MEATKIQRERLRPTSKTINEDLRRIARERDPRESAYVLATKIVRYGATEAMSYIEKSTIQYMALAILYLTKADEIDLPYTTTSLRKVVAMDLVSLAEESVENNRIRAWRLYGRECQIVKDFLPVIQDAIKLEAAAILEKRGRRKEEDTPIPSLTQKGVCGEGR